MSDYQELPVTEQEEEHWRYLTEQIRYARSLKEQKQQKEQSDGLQQSGS